MYPLLFVNGDRESLARELRQRGDLVVIASLIDKIPNLAGLARTCEVFDAKYVRSTASAWHQLFTKRGQTQARRRLHCEFL